MDFIRQFLTFFRKIYELPICRKNFILHHKSLCNAIAAQALFFIFLMVSFLSDANDD